MKTYFLIILFLFFCEETFAQSGLISPNGVSFPTYNAGTRPAANIVGTGTVLYNSIDNIHQFSNGSAWLNLLGTTSFQVAQPIKPSETMEVAGWQMD